MDYDRPEGSLRVLKEEYRDMSYDANIQHVLDTYGDSVLMGSVRALQTVNEEAAVIGSAAKNMIDQVLGLPSVHRATF